MQGDLQVEWQVSQNDCFLRARRSVVRDVGKDVFTCY